ncbi:GNAT family N-acetyltransferase [archaeon]|nr:GNAT family N-acetyltransferase [archaeon]
MRIRKASPADMDWLAETYWQVIRDNFANLNVGKAIVRKRLASLFPNHQIWVAEDKERPLGWVWVELRDDEFTGKKNCIVWCVYVKPEVRRTGIGSELAEKVAAEARRQGADRITLGVTNHNKTAQKFFNQAGFVKTRTVMQKLL